MVDRTIRRVVWRRPAAAAADAPAPVAPARSDELLVGAPTFDIAPSDPIIALLQSATGAVELGNLELDSPALAEMRGGGHHAGRPARDERRADRPAERRAAPLRPGLLARRPAPARDARRAGGAGRSRRPARPRAGDRDSRPRPARAGAPGRAADSAELPAEAAARARRLAGGGVLPAGPHGRRRLLRLHRAARRAHRARDRRRDRQGHPGRDGDGGDEERAARQRPAAARARLGARARQRPASAPTSPRTCSSPASTACSIPRPGYLRYANAGHNLPLVAAPAASRSCARPACRSA